MFKSTFKLGATVLLLVGIMVMAACGSSSTSSASTNPNKFSLKQLRLGLIPLDNATTEIGETQLFAAELQQALGVPVILSVGTTYTASIEAEASGKVDAVLYGPLSFLLANSKYNIQFLCRQLNSDGTPTYNSLIVTTPQTGITSLAQLKGHSFSFTDPASTSGYLIPTYTLTEAGIDPTKDITPVFSGNHTASITAIVNHKVDAGAVASDTFAQEEAKGLFSASDVVILNKSFDIYEGPIGVPSSMSTNDQRLLKAAFESIKDQNALTQAGLGGFVDGSAHDYDNILKAIQTLGLNLNTLGG